MARTPAERSLQARMAAHVLHSKVDSREHTKPAREAFLARFERQVDPDGVLPEDERRRRAESAKKAYMGSLTLKRLQKADARKRAS